MSSLLVKFMEEDRIANELKASKGVEREMSCFFPDHDDKDPSMSVNVNDGVYFCHGCGKKGNAYQYLLDFRNLSKQEAMAVMNKASGGDENYVASKVNEAEATANKVKTELYTFKSIPKRVPLKKGSSIILDLVKEYKYYDINDRLIFIVARYETKFASGEGKKTFRTFSKKKTADEYYAAAPLNKSIPDKDRMVDKCPLYGLNNIKGLPKDTQIWFVEGEKCVDVMSTVKTPSGDAPPCVSMYGGSKKHPEHQSYDLGPLKGRKVVMLADRDKEGRDFSLKIGHYLKTKLDCNVRFFLPEGQDGFDVADAAATGSNGWDTVKQFIQDNGGVVEYDDVLHLMKDFVDEEPVPTPEEITADILLQEGAIGQTEFYKILGHQDNCQSIVFRVASTQGIVVLAVTKMTQMTELMRLAPRSYWIHLAGGKPPSQNQKEMFIDQMIKFAQDLGQIDPNSFQLFGRGGMRGVDDELLFNTGEHLLVANSPTDTTLNKLVPLSEKEIPNKECISGPTINIIDDPDWQDYARDLYESVSQYRWENPQHADVFLGWIVTSIIGGALPFRPMVWLTAPAQSGKTYIMNQVMAKVLSGLVTMVTDATGAGLAAASGSDSLPICIDEFEPGENNNRQEEIMTIMRSATSGEGARLRGDTSGGYKTVNLRFSMLMGSVNRPNLNEANDTRIIRIRLSATAHAADTWKNIKTAIEQATKHRKCLIIQSAIIRHTPLIVRMAEKIEEELVGDGMETREAQIMAALSAGVCFLSGNHSKRIASLKVEEGSFATDKYAIFRYLMACFVKVDYEGRTHEMTVAECLKRAYVEDDLLHQESKGQLVPRQNANRTYSIVCERYGFSMIKLGLCVSRDNHHLRKLLKNSEFEKINVNEYIMGLPRADIPKKGKRNARMTMAGTRTEYMYVPFETMLETGFYSSQSDIDENDENV